MPTNGADEKANRTRSFARYTQRAARTALPVIYVASVPEPVVTVATGMVTTGIVVGLVEFQAALPRRRPGTRLPVRLAQVALLSRKMHGLHCSS